MCVPAVVDCQLCMSNRVDHELCARSSDLPMGVSQSVDPFVVCGHNNLDSRRIV